MSTIVSEPQRRLHDHLTDTCHELPQHVRALTTANSDGAAAAQTLAEHCAAHPEFDGANTHHTTRWSIIIFVSLMAWVTDAALVASFSAYLVGLFLGTRVFFLLKVIATLVVTFFMSLIGASLIVGTRLMIEKARRERRRGVLRFWQAIGVLVCLIPLLLVTGLALAVTAQHSLGGVAMAVAGSHLFWLAIAAMIATAVLVFSGEIGNDAKAWFRFRQKKRAMAATVERHRDTYRAADAAGVHAGMDLMQGTKLYVQTYGARPVLPPLDRDVEQFLRDRFSNALVARRDDAEPNDADA